MSLLQVGIVLLMLVVVHAEIMDDDVSTPIFLKPHTGVGAAISFQNGRILLEIPEEDWRMATISSELPKRALTDSTIVAVCAKRWTGIQKMQTQCFSKQKAAVSNMRKRLMSSDYRLNIRSFCAWKWEEDYFLRDWCESRYTKALSKRERQRSEPKSVNSAISTIKAKCANEWPGDFSMQKYCAKTQKESYDKLQARAMNAEPFRSIRSKCQQEWPQDYSMQNYCEEEQVEAYEEINR